MSRNARKSSSSRIRSAGISPVTIWLKALGMVGEASPRWHSSGYVQRVRFTTDGRGPSGEPGVCVLVDERGLVELVREVELPHARAEGAPGIAGAYAGLRPSQLAAGLRTHFLGGQGSDLSCGPADKTVLLGCD